MALQSCLLPVRGLPILPYPLLHIPTFSSSLHFPFQLQNPLESFWSSSHYPTLLRLVHTALRHTTVQSPVSVYVIPCILARFPQSILFGFPFARSVVYYSHVLYSSYIFFGFLFASLSDLPRHCKVALHRDPHLTQSLYHAQIPKTVLNKHEHIMYMPGSATTPTLGMNAH